jgi:photosystem II stability/assembly factor-like uncharacterized protein
MNFALATPAIMGTLILASGNAFADAPPAWNLLADFGTMEVSDLVVQPDNDQVLWASFITNNADSSGVWKSVDAGITWDRVLDSGGKTINCVDFDPDNMGYAWVGWEASKVSVTPDGGAHWQEIAGFGGGNKVFDIAIPSGNDPSVGPYRVYFGTLNGVYLTNDGGTTLTQITDFLPISRIQVCPDNSDLVWAGKSTGGAIYTTDGGTTWNDVDPAAFDDKDRIRDLIMDPTDCARIMIRAWKPNANDFVGITEDGGTNWTALDSETGAGILLNPTDAGTYYGSGGQLGIFYSSTGDAFDVFDQGFAENPTVLAAVPNDGMLVYAGGGSGIYSNTVDFRPAPPANVTAACSDSAEVTIEWEVVTTNADGSPIDDLAGYSIWADLPPFGSLDTMIAQVMDPAATSFTQTEFGDMIVVSYNVAALDGAGIDSHESNFTNFVAWQECETGVEGGAPSPSGTQTVLEQNAPNPFNPLTSIPYHVGVTEAGQSLSVAIYNARGELVRTLVNEIAQAGAHRITWDGTDEHNATVSSGVYFARLSIGSVHAVRSMLLVK